MKRITESSVRRLVRMALINESDLGLPVDMPLEKGDASLSGLSDEELRMMAMSGTGSDTQMEAEMEMRRREQAGAQDRYAQMDRERRQTGAMQEFLEAVADSVTERLLAISAPGDDVLSTARRSISKATGMGEFEAVVDGTSIVVGSNSETPVTVILPEPELVRAVVTAFKRLQSDLSSNPAAASLTIGAPKRQMHKDFTGTAYVFPVKTSRPV